MRVAGVLQRILLLMAIPSVLTRAQGTDVGSTTVRELNPPTARTFGYPQSLFVDSQSGNIWVADFDNNRMMRFDVMLTTSVSEEGLSPGRRFSLNQNYPNPFNPNTTIEFVSHATEPATVKVYDVMGREVATLFDDMAVAHTVYSLSFSAANLSTGVYFYRLSSRSGIEVRKMGVLK